MTFNFPNDIIDGDAVLVYRLESIQNGLDIWEPLPTSLIYLDDGSLFQFRYNYSKGDVEIIAESENLPNVGDEFMLNQIFRIVVMPSDMMSSVDTNNLEAVMSSLNMNEKSIQTIQEN